MNILLFIICVIVTAFRQRDENKYILLSTSKFWFNVRQAINSLIIYQQLKEFGVKDENIILMIPEDSACNRKNNNPGVICPYDNQLSPNMYRNVVMDYKREDVNIKNWIDIMRGKYDPYTPQSRRLQLSKNSKLMMFLNGHGGDGYTKMQDTTYLLDFEMAKVTKEMSFLNRYSEAFLISDSCGAATLYETVEAPNMIMLGSSIRTQKSYSQGLDDSLLQSKTDRFTYTTYNWLRDQIKNNNILTIQDQVSIYDPAVQQCNAKLWDTLQTRKLSQVKASEFWKQKKIAKVEIKRNNQKYRAKTEFLNLLL